MKEHQREALRNTVDSEELLKAAWDSPRRYNFDKRRFALVVLMTAVSNGKFVWEVSIRLQSRKQSFLTAPHMWTTVERKRVIQMLMNETLGIGDPMDQEIWSSKNALHITKAMTAEEIELAKSVMTAEEIELAKTMREGRDAASGPEEGREAASEAGGDPSSIEA